MTGEVEFSVSYRALSDSAFISCADSAVAEALGVPVDEVEQQQLDHDTTVESLGVELGDTREQYFLAAQVLGVAARSRHGLVDHVLPMRLHSTLMALVHEPLPEQSDVLAVRRAITRVPLPELGSFWSLPKTDRHPPFEVKAVCAALDDLSRTVGCSARRTSSAGFLREMSDSLCVLANELDEADGLPVPMAVAHTSRVLLSAPEVFHPVTVPVGEAVFDLTTGESWEDAARILRDARPYARRLLRDVDPIE